MSNNQTLSTAALVAVFATAIFLVAFALMLVVGGFGIVGSIFMSLVVALVAAIVLALGFGGGSARAMPQPKVTAERAAAPAAVSPAAASPAPAPAPEPAPAAEAEAPAAAEPEAAPAAAAAPSGDGRPAALGAPRGGTADNLKEIKGVGPKLEELLNSMGIYHFDQIANWTEAEIAWVDENLEGFKGRVTRDDWVAQAKILASGGETEFSKRVEDGDVY